MKPSCSLPTGDRFVVKKKISVSKTSVGELVELSRSNSFVPKSVVREKTSKVTLRPL